MDSSTTISELIAELSAVNVRRAWWIWDEQSGAVRASHPAGQPIADWLANLERDYDAHEGLFVEIGATGALHGAFVHRTVRGQGAGGVRYQPYSNVESYLRDGLRLARGMGRKNALAQLWWGGGKGVIAPADGTPLQDPDARRTLYREYGRFVSSLQGCYVTAEDAGTGPADMAEVFARTRFTTCVPPSVGGSGNPSPATARGVVRALEAAFEHTGETLKGKTIAMQGAGNVGGPMIADLLAAGAARIVAVDVSETVLEQLRGRFASDPVELRSVARDDTSIFSEPCDAFVPNALGGVLEPSTIAELRASIVCGAANNQLLDEARDDALLADRGITYVPDFVANRMGIVNCANEQYGCLSNDPAIERHLGRDWDGSVYRTTLRILAEAAKSDTTTGAAAAALADEAAAVPHPIWGHRGRAIVHALAREGWAERAPEPEPASRG